MPIELIAGTPPGGGQDRAARALASVLDVEVTIRNVPGRGGGEGWDLLVKGAGRSDLAAISSPTLITNRLTGLSSLAYDELTPLATLYSESSLFVVAGGSDLSDPDALLAALAAGSTRVAFATEIGNMNHLVLAEITAHLGARVGPIEVFESALLAIDEVVAGRVPIAVVSAVSSFPAIEAGALAPVMSTSPSRLGGVIAGVPTCAELGIPCVRGTWRGLVGPPGVDSLAISTWANRLRRAVNSPSWRALLEKGLWVDEWRGPVETTEFLRAEQVGLARLLADLGLMPEESLDG